MSRRLAISILVASTVAAAVAGSATLAVLLDDRRVPATPVADFGTLAPAPSVPATPPRHPAPLPARPAPLLDGESAFYSDLEKDVALPVRLRIPTIGVDAQVEPVGYEAARDAMAVPRDGSTVGWYEFGPSPGQEGSAVLAAHVDFGGNAGVFFDLHELSAGSAIYVGFEDGSERVFVVVARRSYEKESLPTDQLFARNGAPVVTLITCGGAFNPGADSYEDNVVVFAVPLGEAEVRELV